VTGLRLAAWHQTTLNRPPAPWDTPPIAVQSADASSPLRVGGPMFALALRLDEAPTPIVDADPLGFGPFTIRKGY